MVTKSFAQTGQTIVALQVLHTDLHWVWHTDDPSLDSLFRNWLEVYTPYLLVTLSDWIHPNHFLIWYNNFKVIVLLWISASWIWLYTKIHVDPQDYPQTTQTPSLVWFSFSPQHHSATMYSSSKHSWNPYGKFCQYVAVAPSYSITSHTRDRKTFHEACRDTVKSLQLLVHYNYERAVALM